MAGQDRDVTDERRGPECGGRRMRGAKGVRRGVPRAAGRELCPTLTVPGVGDEEGSVEDAPQARDRRPRGGLPRAPVAVELGAAQRGERARRVRPPAGPRSIRSMPSSINAGRPASGEDAGRGPPEISAASASARMTCHTTQPSAGSRVPPDLTDARACSATAHALPASPRAAASSASAPSSAGRYERDRLIPSISERAVARWRAASSGRP